MSSTALDRSFNETRKYLLAYAGHAAELAPKGTDGRRLLRVVLSCLNQKPKLVEVASNDFGRRSLLIALLESTSLGLAADGLLGEGWLIPYGRVIKFQAGYQGLKTVAYRHPKILKIQARTVYKNERFRIVGGTEDRLEHEPILSPEDRGAAVAYYAWEELAGGAVLWEAMDRSELEARRDRFSKAYNKAMDDIARAEKAGKTHEAERIRAETPWLAHPNAMAQKTLLSIIAKRGPRSAELAAAVHTTERGEDQRTEKQLESEEDAVIDAAAVIDGSPREEIRAPETAIDTVKCDGCGRHYEAHRVMDGMCTHCTDQQNGG